MSPMYYSSVVSAPAWIPSLFAIAFYILTVVAYWKLFSKSGEAGWKSLIPIYNDVIFFKMVGLNPWLVLVMWVSAIIPLVGWIVFLIIRVMFFIRLYGSYVKEDGTQMSLVGYILGIVFTGALVPIYFYAYDDSYYYVGPLLEEVA